MRSSSSSVFQSARDEMVLRDKAIEAVRTLIAYAGDDPEREGVIDTPDRVIRAYAELFSGYSEDPIDHLKVFDNKDGCNEMIIQRDIPFTSTCEHHMLPFMGTAHIAYIPDGKVIGVSKLIRILEVFSRRLQIQERMTEQITRALDGTLTPLGAACIIKAQHLCMVCRGVNRSGSYMVTSSLTGEFLKPEVRSEFFALTR